MVILLQLHSFSMRLYKTDIEQRPFLYTSLKLRESVISLLTITRKHNKIQPTGRESVNINEWYLQYITLLRKCQYQKKGGEIVESAVLIPFGKEIKKKLVDMDRNQNWLIEKVAATTGLYFDRSYLHKIMTGQLNTPKIIQAIREILDISE